MITELMIIALTGYPATLARFEKAGEEYGAALHLSAETITSLEKPMIPAEEYIRQVNGNV